MRQNETPCLAPSCPQPDWRAARSRRGQALCSAVLVALLGGCGGGGGDSAIPSPSPPTTPSTVAISASNRDVVAQAATASVQGLGSGSTSVPLAAEGGTARAAGANPSQAGAPRRVGSGLLPAAARTQLMQLMQAPSRQALYSRAAQKRALAVTGPISQPCSLGGSMAITADDSNNDGAASAGDSVAVVFSACQESAGETLSGNMRLVFTQVRTDSETVLDVSARLTLSDLRLVNNGQTISTTGQALMDIRSDSQADDRLTVTVEDTIVATLTGTVTDTVTLQAGYVETSVYDSRIAAPEGGSAGRTTTTVSGTVSSTRAGGRFALTTPTPLVQFDVDSYPRSGVMLAQGSGSALRLTALTGQQVQLELDADGNGQYESSNTVNWSSLL